ncbi:MAG: hydroxypyruvate isomerase [Rhodocyclaceae bacterium]|nr:hydroxypyruvate isomerase [Rhodocyclaceae bacterium]
MPRFSANLSFLFPELDLPDRFAAARDAGFAAVEFHFPYAFDRGLLADAAAGASLPVVLFNLPAGDWAGGERGIACHPERMAEFQDGVGAAVEWARLLGCPRVNCLAGIPPPGVSLARARETLVENLRFAAAVLQRAGVELVMEPLNTRDTPGFLVSRTRQGLDIIAEAACPNLRLQYDVYHAQVMEGDLARTLAEHLPRIGHVQIADNPGRGEPGTGEINFPFLFAHLDRIGYAGWVGCEYRPSGGRGSATGWMRGTV